MENDYTYHLSNPFEVKVFVGIKFIITDYQRYIPFPKLFSRCIKIISSMLICTEFLPVVKAINLNKACRIWYRWNPITVAATDGATFQNLRNFPRCFLSSEDEASSISVLSMLLSPESSRRIQEAKQRRSCPVAPTKHTWRESHFACTPDLAPL